MAKTKRERREIEARRPPEPKSRSETHAPLRKPPTKRGARGAQLTARHDMERGVTSRARKSRTGDETVPDPRYGGRPGRRKSKWSARRERALEATLHSARERAERSPIRERRVHVRMDRALYDRFDRIVQAERMRTKSARLTIGDYVAEVLRAYRPPRETEEALRSLARAGREHV